MDGLHVEWLATGWLDGWICGWRPLYACPVHVHAAYSYSDPDCSVLRT